GFAHLFEHMMFEGSEHVGEKAHFKYIQSAGGTDINGTTSFDRTNYFETMPSNQLELALWLESDRMGFLMEGLDRQKLTNQRDVVRNERRQGEGQPYSLANEQVFHLLFPQNHPYYGNVIGSHADIEAARIADVRDFHQQFYTPNNASIAIAGDFDPKALRALLTKYFGPVPKGPDAPAVTAVTPPLTSQKRATVTDTVQLPQVRVAWLTPPAYTPGAYDADTALYALGGSKAGRLTQLLVYKKQVAQSANCFNIAIKLTGIASCVVTAKPGQKLEDIEASIWSEVARLQTEGPTPEEVEANKAGNITAKITGLQRLGGFGGIADTLDAYNQYTGDPGFLPKDIAMTEAVTVASAKAAAAKLTRDSSVVVYTVPGKKVVDDVPRSPDTTDADVKITNPYPRTFETAQNWRKAAPPAGPAPQVHLPVPATFALKNGLKVYLLEDHALPVLSAQLVVRAGSDSNPEGKSGLATLTTELMGDGTQTRGLEQLARDEERIGITIAPAASTDGSNAALTVLTSYANPGMDLLSDVVEHPAFRPEDVERRRKQRLLRIQQETDSVQQMALRVGPRLLFGDTPYGMAPNGTTESIRDLKADDITTFYKAHFGPQDAALVFAGDVSAAQARQLAEKYFGDWSGSASPAVTLPAAPAPQPTHIVIVDKPGAPQTALYAFGAGVPATAPELPTIRVANYTLGGSFSSRINMNLREVHGYTYGARSQFEDFRSAGQFRAGGLIRTDVTAPAAKELMTELHNFPNHPPSAGELSAAKTALVQSLPGQFETTGATAGAIASIFVYNRPLDYYAALPARYSAVTSTDVARVAQEDLHPDQIILVAAGDRSKIEPSLKEAGLGPVEVRTIDGQPVTAPAAAPVATAGAAQQ
ncbi:MAG: insulinase family protein, partial [Rhodospirillales bacterium]|nr:insulinase family protein [Acetobacter sp.]